MVRFMCQLGWVMVLRYLAFLILDVSVKMFWMRLTYKWVGLIPSAEGIKRLVSSKQVKTIPSDSLHTSTATLSLPLS